MFVLMTLVLVKPFMMLLVEAAIFAVKANEILGYIGQSRPIQTISCVHVNSKILYYLDLSGYLHDFFIIFICHTR